MTYHVAVLIGSLRKESLNRKMAHALKDLAPTELLLEEVTFRDLPLYDPDLEGDDAPQAWHTFREQIAAADAVLFVTPEYNRSVPGGLKNALDVGSRPKSTNAWGKKPAAIVTVSPGNLGGFGANHHLRQMFVSLDLLPLQQPEMYIGQGAKLFAEDGSITAPDTRTFLANFMIAFQQHIDRTLK